MRVFFPLFFKKKQKRIEKRAWKKKRSKSKKKTLYQEVINKARTENATLKRELHGLLKVQGSVLSTILKNLSG